METGKVYTDGVVVGDRLRRLDEAKVAGLAESMSQIGLQQPISIWADGDTPHLVAGRHRLAAAIKLGWEQIDCIFVTLSERRRRIWEIDENLYRNELSTDEMREHLRERKRLWEEEQGATEAAGKSFPTSLPDGRRAGPQHRKQFAAETAEATGLSKRRINQLLADPKPTPPKPVPPPPAEPMNDMEISNKVRRRMAAAWNAAPPVDREWFREWIDTPAAKWKREAA